MGSVLTVPGFKIGRLWRGRGGLGAQAGKVRFQQLESMSVFVSPQVPSGCNQESRKHSP